MLSSSYFNIQLPNDKILNNEGLTLLTLLARIGLADVREFGLSWDDCYDYLHRLGYDIKVEVSEVS